MIPLNSLLNEFIKFAKECHDKISKDIGGASTSKNLNSILVVCNYIRVGELFHSVVVLAAERVPSGCFVVLRTMVETYIHLHGCVNDETFHKEYIKKHVNEKRKRIRRLATDLASVKMSLTPEEVADMEKHQSELLEQHQGKTLADAQQVFQRFGREDLYHQVFAHCSLWVHNDSHTYDRYLIETEQNIELCDYKNLEKDTILCLLMALKIEFLAYEDIAKLLGKQPKHREEFVKTYNQFHDKFGEFLK